MKYYFEAFRKYAVFVGRSSRAEYWSFILVNILMYCLLTVVDGVLGVTLGNSDSAIINFYNLLTIIPTLAVGIRRLHDIGRSGWWLLCPLINIVFLLMPGEIADNAYGSNPIYTSNAPTHETTSVQKKVVLAILILLSAGFVGLLIAGLGQEHPKAPKNSETLKARSANASVGHLDKVVEYQNKASAYVLNARSDSEMNVARKQYMIYMRKALEEARLVDDVELDKKKKGWAAHFKNELIPALEILSTEKTSVKEDVSAQKLMVQYVEWSKKEFGLSDDYMPDKLRSMTAKQISIILGNLTCSTIGACNMITDSTCSEKWTAAIALRLERLKGKVDVSLVYNCIRDLGSSDCELVRRNEWPQSCSNYLSF